jgi:hypothetical protein
MDPKPMVLDHLLPQNRGLTLLMIRLYGVI